MLWYSLVKRFERSAAVERFELASVNSGSSVYRVGPSYIVASSTVSSQIKVF
jgi:hypothetical protein